MKLFYDSRLVTAHDGQPGASVLLMNEAPGPSEAASGIPSFGQQGANIYHALRKAGIAWALAHPQFVWPRNGATTDSPRHRHKAAFLAGRARHITCTNAYPRWPKPAPDATGFCPPAEEDVLSPDNLTRIKSEISSSHRVILICGHYAYLACLGNRLPEPASREATELTAEELDALNHRLAARFEQGWYMGHTRRWSTRPNETTAALRRIARYVGWSLE